jgi:hypothetical protein
MKRLTIDGIDCDLPETDYELAEFVGHPGWELQLVADWSRKQLTWTTKIAGDTSLPMSEWQGHQERFRVPAMTKADARGLLFDLAPLAARVCAGYHSEWDGSNVIGQLTDDAFTAANRMIVTINEAIDSRHHPDGAGELWAAEEWLQGELPECINELSTDAELRTEASDIQKEAHHVGLHLHGLDDYLEGIRETERRRCHCGDITGERCGYDDLEPSETVVVEHVAAFMRQTALAAGGDRWRHAVKILCCSLCAYEHEDDEWIRVVGPPSWVPETDFAAGLQAARVCGAGAAMACTGPIPEWTGEPVLYADWDFIEQALGDDPAGLDSVATQELMDAWLAGYNAVRLKRTM